MYLINLILLCLFCLLYLFVNLFCFCFCFCFFLVFFSFVIFVGFFVLLCFCCCYFAWLFKTVWKLNECMNEFYYIDIDEIPWFPSLIKTIISLVKLPFLFHSRYISRHFVIDVIWRLPVWNVQIWRYLASCTLQFWSNLTKVIFQGNPFNYFIVVGGWRLVFWSDTHYKGRSPSNGKLSDFSFHIDSQTTAHRKFKK